MAKKIDDGLTIQAIPVEEKQDEHPVTVTLPLLEDPGNAGLRVDQYEHVTIANEEREDIHYVLRGEPVAVSIPVFCQLKNRYPKL